MRCAAGSGVDVVFFNQFPTRDALDHWYESVRQAGHVDTDSGDENSCPREGGYATDNVHTGRDLCFIDEKHTAVVDWSHEKLLIGAEAQRNDGNGAALTDWWKDDSGPVE